MSQESQSKMESERPVQMVNFNSLLPADVELKCFVLLQIRKRSVPNPVAVESSSDVTREAVTSEKSDDEADRSVSRRTRSRSDVARPARDVEQDEASARERGESPRKDVGQKLMTQAKALMVSKQVRLQVAEHVPRTGFMMSKIFRLK